RLQAQATKLSRVRSTVLLTGEIGVGRRHIAQWLHQNGPDNDKPLLVARPNRVITTEALESAGTLLIPSVDSWDHAAQTLLQQQLETLEPGHPPRVIATSGPELDQKVSAQTFRPDLYFRLAVLMMPVPPLRERPEDIEPLLNHFLEQNAQVFEKPIPPPTAAQLARLRQHQWTGNIRELSNLAERAAVLGEVVFDMPVKPRSATGLPELTPGFNLSDHMEEMEKALLIQAIEQTNGDRPKMSRLLGLERNTLRYKLNKYKLLKRT
ncbi:MAG: helix-turn-helix domain-containing protein, partial [Myxococcota bacterium]